MNPEEEIWVNGRHETLNVDPVEIRAASTRVGAVAERVWRIRREVMGRSTTVLDAVPSQRSRGMPDCSLSLHLLGLGLDDLVSRLRLLAGSAREAALSYEEEERGAVARIGGLGAGLQSFLPALPWFLGLLVTGGQPLLLEAYRGQLRAMGQKDDVASLTELLFRLGGGTDRAKVLASRLVVTSAQSAQAPPPPSAGSTLASGFRSVLDAYGQGEPFRNVGNGGRAEPVPLSSIIVDKYRRKDGHWAVVVSVPGTQLWELDSWKTSNDIRGNIDGMAQAGTKERYLTQTQTAILTALEREGVTKSDQLVINAHSQGGIHVASLAAMPEFTTKYTVRALNLAGAPVARFLPQVDASVLAVENRDDIVPSLDTRSNPVRGKMTTVVFPDGPRETLGSWTSTMATSRDEAAFRAAKLVTPLQALDKVDHAHALKQYISAAERIEGSRSPEVRRHLEVLTDVLGAGALDSSWDGRVRSSRTVYTAHEDEAPGTQCRTPFPENRSQAPGEGARGMDCPSPSAPGLGRRDGPPPRR
ncbi:hypothetical protein [Arthrobacter sp. NPDC090010]|uniref:hypothetical protein n=1 Tax=Arthrobacter sp. NPDC090010 TaxID=3363942 RepID=UPI00382D5123